MSTSTNFMESKIALNFEDPSIFHDRILIVGEKKFHVVSMTLSMWSEYFRGLFNGNFEEADKKEIELKELDPELFETFLKLIYLNNLVDLKDADIIPLIQLSYRFLTPMVLEQCLDYIDKNFDRLDEIKLEILETACIHGIINLQKKMINYFNDEKQLAKFSIEKILDIAKEHYLDDLKSNTYMHMKKNVSFDNCSEYLDCCQKFHSINPKAEIKRIISNWKSIEIPPTAVIGLLKAAFKHKIQSLKMILRNTIYGLTESNSERYNRKRDCVLEIVPTTFNWFLKDNQEEIYALPAEIMKFIITSTCQCNM